MAKIVILGAGMMGTAISTPMADNGHDVALVGTHLDTDIIEEIHETRKHPKLYTRVADGVQPYPLAGLREAIRDVDLVVLGVNSRGVRWAAETLGPVLPAEVPVVAVTKGLADDNGKLQLLPDLFKACLPLELQSRLRIAAIGGPSIAGELAARRHTSIVITGRDPSLLEQIATLLRTPYYHVWTSTDFVGVEVSVAVKNLYALAVGVVQGMLESQGLSEHKARMHNMAAAIFAQGLWESTHLVEALGGDRSNMYSLPGAGDLYVTSVGGRNMRMGRFLGLGMGYRQAKEQHFEDETIEGAELAFTIETPIEAMIEQGVLQAERLPLMRSMFRIICHEESIQIPWDSFFHGAYVP